MLEMHGPVSGMPCCIDMRAQRPGESRTNDSTMDLPDGSLGCQSKPAEKKPTGTGKIIVASLQPEIQIDVPSLSDRRTGHMQVTSGARGGLACSHKRFEANVTRPLLLQCSNRVAATQRGRSCRVVACAKPGASGDAHVPRWVR